MFHMVGYIEIEIPNAFMPFHVRHLRSRVLVDSPRHVKTFIHALALNLSRFARGFNVSQRVPRA